MKKIATVVIAGAFLLSAMPVQAAGLTESQKQAIISLIMSFGADEATLNNVRASLGLSTSNSNTGSSQSGSGRQNLSVSSVTLSYPNGISSGPTPYQQKVTVAVKADQYGSYQLSGEMFDYVMYLYDVTGGKNKKLMKAASGEALVPYANGYSEFSAFIEGGMPFDGSTYEKEYQAEIQIDTKNKVKESNEKDNKTRSSKWGVDYYKG